MHFAAILVVCVVCLLQFHDIGAGVVSDILSLGSTKQRLIIKGKLLCGSKAAKDTYLKLLDLDPGFDDEMAKTKTNDQGEFLLDGTTEERTSIDGIIKIYHDCNDYLPCQRRWKIKIPNKYIINVDSKNANLTTLDIGTWNLEVYLHDEDRDCYH